MPVPRVNEAQAALLLDVVEAVLDSKQLERADDGTRTRDPHLGKVMLYQLSHVRSTRLTLPSAPTDPLCVGLGDCVR